MGVVFEAVDETSGERVALKTLRDLDPQALYRLKREFRNLEGIRHQNLVSLGELIEAQGQWFFTMELVEGVDFLSYVRPPPGGWLPPETALPPSQDTLRTERSPAVRTSLVTSELDEDRLRPALAQLAISLAELHGHGLVHRDVKPSNVLVAKDGRVVVLDFGLVASSSEERMSLQGHAVGTAEYMAPEQAISMEVTPAADWYAFGVMLYESLTGRLPFAGAPLDVLMRKQRHEPPPPRAVWSDVPRDLDSLCVELLAFEPAARPSGESVLERLGAGDAPGRRALPPSSQLTQTAPFVGRDAELALLQRALDEVRGGKPVVVNVQGDSGLGKSELVRQFAEQTAYADEDVVVLAGRCYERETIPFKACDGVLDSLSRYLTRLSMAEASVFLPRNASLLPHMFRVLERVEAIARSPRPRREVLDPHELRNRVFESLRELLYKLSERRTVIVVIDDVQWADADSLALLHEMMRPPHAPAILLLVTSRLGSGISGELDGVIPGEVRTLPLLPLEPRAARKLASALLARLGVADRVSASLTATEAHGHPLFIDELARYAAANLDTGDPPPVRLEQAIATRVAQLDRGTAHLLELIAIAAVPLSPDLLRNAAELPRDEVPRRLGELHAAHLVRRASRGSRGDDRVEPFHDRIRETILDAMTSEHRRAHHRRLATALESAGVEVVGPELLVRHLEAAGETKRAAEYAITAARNAAQTLAFDRAALLYRKSLDLQQPTGADRSQVVAELADVLANAGRCVEAADAYEQAADGAEPARRLQYQTRAAQEYLFGGHVDAGLRVLEEVTFEARLPTLRTARLQFANVIWQRFWLNARGLGWSERFASEIPPKTLKHIDAYLGVSSGLAMFDPVRAMSFLLGGMSLALRCGEPTRVARSLMYYALGEAVAGGRRVRKARALLERARPLVDGSESPYLHGVMSLSEGAGMYFDGRFRDAVLCLRAAESSIREQTTGSWSEINFCRSLCVFAMHMTGDIRELSALLDAYTRDAERRGDRYALTTFLRYRNYVRLANDDVAATRAALDEVRRDSAGRRFHLQDFFEEQSRIELALYDSDPALSRATCRNGYRSFHGSLANRVIQISRADSECAWGRVAIAEYRTKKSPGALRDAMRSARRLSREGTAYAMVWAELLRAGVEWYRHDDAGALTALGRAAEVADETCMTLHALAARRRAGEVLGGDEGAARVARADARLGELGVACPARMVGLIAPGFDART